MHSTDDVIEWLLSARDVSGAFFGGIGSSNGIVDDLYSHTAAANLDTSRNNLTECLASISLFTRIPSMKNYVCFEQQGYVVL